MSDWIGYALAVLIIVAALVIFAVRITRFIRTRGQSACEHCPYAGHCSGSCGKQKTGKRS